MEYNFDDINKTDAPFFDSGTTLFHIKDSLYDALVAEYSMHCARNPLNCAGQEEFSECNYWDKEMYPHLNDFLRTFPIMTFFFSGDKTYKWHPQDYMVISDEDPSFYCVSMKSNHHTILGAVFMRNYDIYIDRSTKTLSFNRANCASDPYFIDSLNGRSGDDSSYGLRNPLRDAINMAEASNASIVDLLSKNGPSSLSGADEQEDNIYEFEIAIISIIFSLGVVGTLALMKYFWAQKKIFKKGETEASTADEPSDQSTLP